MHAANLLHKKRQQEERRREEKEKHVGTPTSGSTPTVTTKHQNSKQYLLVDHQSQSSSSMSPGGAAGGSVSPIPPSHSKHNITLPATISFNVEQKPNKKHKENKKKIMGPKLVDSNTSTAAATPTSYYHKEENFFNCAHVGLCIMILGVIIMTITGFVSHLLGFGEPGVIIVTGGACFCAVGLLLLCFGNAWYIRKSKTKSGILNFVEIGRASLEGNEMVAP